MKPRDIIVVEAINVLPAVGALSHPSFLKVTIYKILVLGEAMGVEFMVTHGCSDHIASHGQYAYRANTLFFTNPILGNYIWSVH